MPGVLGPRDGGRLCDIYKVLPVETLLTERVCELRYWSSSLDSFPESLPGLLGGEGRDPAICATKPTTKPGVISRSGLVSSRLCSDTISSSPRRGIPLYASENASRMATRAPAGTTGSPSSLSLWSGRFSKMSRRVASMSINDCLLRPYVS